MAQKTDNSRDMQPSASVPEQEALQLQEDWHRWQYIHRVGTASSEKKRSRIGQLWRRYIVISVPHEGSRDHWANERTALSYIRTAQAFSVFGVVIAQLMRLNAVENPDPVFGYFKLAIPLASICQSTAIIICVVGMMRFFHWQTEMALGRALSSGWEFLLTFILGLAILMSTFVLCLVISIERST